VYSLFEIFRIPIPKSEYMVAKTVTVRKVRSPLRDFDLVDSYVAAALFVFVHLGLIPALVKLGIDRCVDDVLLNWGGIFCFCFFG
jgi:hypothetical protein